MIEASVSGGSDRPRTANLLGALALATADRVERATQDAGGRSGTETAALVILTTALEGASQEELRWVLDLTQTGTTRVVARLVRAGLLEQRPGADGRTRALVPTGPGRDVAERALRARAQSLERLLEVLDDAEQQAAARLADKLLSGLTTGGPRGARRVCRLCDPVVCGHPAGTCPVTRAARTSDGDETCRPA